MLTISKLLILLLQVIFIVCQNSNNAIVPISHGIINSYDKKSISHGGISMIDVKCETNYGMVVTIDFEEPFHGIIYSQGYYNDPKCRYVQSGSSDFRFTFTVPFSGCGSKPSCRLCSSVDNILIIQSDEDIQEGWDMARKISCSPNDEQAKTIIFKPFVVDMLEVVAVPTSSGGVECWMNIQRGEYPQISPIDGAIKIGEHLSVLVYLKDPKAEYDIMVKDCYAFDNEDYDARTTSKLKLSEKNGCSSKKNLFGLWRKTVTQDNTGTTLITYNTLKAFKFPDRMQVFLKCDVEICRDKCDEYICDDTRTLLPNKSEKILPSTYSTKKKLDCLIDPSDQRCSLKTTLSPFTISPAAPRCYIGSKDPMCNLFSTTDQKNLLNHRKGCYPGNNDIKCQTIDSSDNFYTKKPTFFENSLTSTISSKNCHPMSNDKRCQQNINAGNPTHVTYLPPPYRKDDSIFTTNQRLNTEASPVRCYPGITDRRCQQIVSSTLRPDAKTLTTLKNQCYPGSQDSSCIQNKPNQTPVKPIDFSSECFPGSNDIRCRRPTISSIQDVSSTTATLFRGCYPGSQHPQCLQKIKPVTEPEAIPRQSTNCNQGGTNFPCEQKNTISQDNNSPTTSSIRDCYPGSKDLKCSQQKRPTSAIEPQRCYPGSTDINCKQTTLKHGSSYLPPTKSVTIERPFNCFPGSTDIRCQKTSKQTSSTQRTFSTQFGERIVFNKTPSSLSSTKCYPGSLDPSCDQKQATYNQPKATSQPFGCYPGSYDIRCKVTTPKTSAQSEFTSAFSRPPDCYSGSTDRRCNFSNQDSTYLPPVTQIENKLDISSKITRPRCFPGSTDLSCNKPENSRKPTSTTIGPYNCSPTSSDLRCQKSTVTILSKQRTTYRPTVSTNQITATKCYPGSTDPKCNQIKISTEAPRKTYTSPNCYPGSKDINCQQYKNFASSTLDNYPSTPILPREENLQCYLGSKNPKCVKNEPTKRPTSSPGKQINCFPGSNDVRCQEFRTTKLPKGGPSYLPPVSSGQHHFGSTTLPTVKKCLPGSNEYQCIQTGSSLSLPKETYRPAYTTKCELNSKDPNCLQLQLSQGPKTTISSLPNCYPGSRDKLCQQTNVLNYQTTKSTNYPAKTTKAYTTIPTFTTSSIQCYPGSVNPLCQQVITPIHSKDKPTYLPPSSPSFTTLSTTSRCYPGSTDPKCFQNNISQQSSKFTPSLPSQYETIKPARFPNCYPGSKDPSCLKIQPSKIPSSTPFSTLNCFPGSRDKTCQQRNDFRYQTTKPTYYPSKTTIEHTTPSFYTTNNVRCTPRSTDIHCQNATLPNSSKQKPTYLPPISSGSSQCYPGSLDPSCSQGEILKQSSKADKCYPGSKNASCLQLQPTQKPNILCFPGSADIRCLQVTESTTKKQSPIYFLPSSDFTTLSTTSKCYPGSTDPKCFQRETSKYTSITTPVPFIHNYSPQQETKRYPGQQTSTQTSFNLRNTYLPPANAIQNTFNSNRQTNELSNSITTSAVSPQTSRIPTLSTYLPSSFGFTTLSTTSKCYPGSTDPKCFQRETSKYSSITTPVPLIHNYSPQQETKRYPDQQTSTQTSFKLRNTYSPSANAIQNTFNSNRQTNEFSNSITTSAVSPQASRIPTLSTYLPSSFGFTTLSTTSKCYPGSTDPKCFQRETSKYSSITTPVPLIHNYSPQQETKRYPDQQTSTQTSFKLRNTYSPSANAIQNTFNSNRQTNEFSNSITTSAVSPQASRIPTLSTYLPSSFGFTTLSTTSKCYPGSTDPKCFQRETSQYTSITTPVPLIHNYSPQQETKPYPGQQTTTPTSFKYRNTYLPPANVVENTFNSNLQINQLSTSITTPAVSIEESRIPSSYQQPLNCFPGSSDPKCKTIISTTQTYSQAFSDNQFKNKTQNFIRTTTPKSIYTKEYQKGSEDQCFYGSKNPQCQKIINSLAKTTSTQPLSSPSKTSINCYIGSNDPKCSQSNLNDEITTYRPPLPAEQSSLCFLGSTDENCKNLKDIERLNSYIPSSNCYPGSADPRCPQPFSLRTTTVNIPSSTLRTLCYPGSTNPRCPSPFSPRPTAVTQLTTRTPATDKIFKCEFGSTDPLCNSASIEGTLNTITSDPYSTNVTPKTTQAIFTKETPTLSSYDIFENEELPNCEFETSDPRCEHKTKSYFNLPTSTPALRPSSTVLPFGKPNCYFGSTDIRCTQTTASSISQELTSVNNFKCYYGSMEPGCPKTATTPSYCHPGSVDPRCPQSPKRLSSRPPATYLPPLSDPFRGLRNARNTLPNEINNLAAPKSTVINSMPGRKKKRDLSETNTYNEVISITLNFKGYQFEKRKN